MGELKLFKGGEFLLVDASPEEVFTPEDFDKEQVMIGKSAVEFGQGELVPRKEELDECNPELLRELMRTAWRLGLLKGAKALIFKTN